MAKEEKEIKHRFGTVNFELRRFPRYSLELPIEYWETESPRNHHGRTINISEGGLMLFITEEIEIGHNLKLKIFFGSSLNLSFIEAQVEVVWKDIHWMSEKDYRIGVKFVDISSGDKEKLENLLEKTNLIKTPQTKLG
jgi:c-di-GMP-binding flagellar brake protein YcgR